MPRENGHVCVFDPRSKRFIDFCHYTEIEQRCKECKGVTRTETPRDFHLNPMQISFARQDCEECRAAVVGIEPASWHAHA